MNLSIILLFMEGVCCGLLIMLTIWIYHIYFTRKVRSTKIKLYLAKLNELRFADMDYSEKAIKIKNEMIEEMTNIIIGKS